MKQVEIAGLHVEASTGTPVVLLREQDAPHRVLPIFIGDAEATAIALVLGGTEPPRPLTHDVMASLVATFDARVDLVEVTGVDDGTFLAEMTISGPAGSRRLDTRPSDAIALALRVDAPLFVSEAVLEEAGAEVTEIVEMPDGVAIDDVAIDDEVIDEQVEAFRAVLDAFDPAQLASDPGPDPDRTPPEDPPSN